MVKSTETIGSLLKTLLMKGDYLVDTGYHRSAPLADYYATLPEQYRTLPARFSKAGGENEEWVNIDLLDDSGAEWAGWFISLYRARKYGAGLIADTHTVIEILDELEAEDREYKVYWGESDVTPIGEYRSNLPVAIHLLPALFTGGDLWLVNPITAERINILCGISKEMSEAERAAFIDELR